MTLTLNLKPKSNNERINLQKGGFGSFMTLALLLLSLYYTYSINITAKADNFTDIFYTQSFRGAFSWLQNLDWIGMILQAVISIFSVLGVSLVAIRIMTSILYLSSRALWDEVSDLKETGESDKYDFGFINMAKNWARGKAGTGLDAILGAILILLPDVKKYSDFGPRAGDKFDQDISITQYILKILLPTVMITFFCAMGFNGTLWQFLAVTVDGMGKIADTAVSINYAGFIDDLIKTGTGYEFSFGSLGTNKGDLQEDIAKDIYGRVVSKVDNINKNQLYAIGQSIEADLKELTISDDNTRVTEEIRAGATSNDPSSDAYWGYLGYEVVVNTSGEDSGADYIFEVSNYVGTSGESGDTGESGITQIGSTKEYIHVYLKQTKSFNGNFFNTDAIAR